MTGVDAWRAGVRHKQSILRVRRHQQHIKSFSEPWLRLVKVTVALMITPPMLLTLMVDG